MQNTTPLQTPLEITQWYASIAVVNANFRVYGLIQASHVGTEKKFICLVVKKTM
ncbi:hypothetical protein RVIR1_13200 [Candidatus Rickettsiella viridis]|uniref:Uncharacterized protein n=1 Tax=Candidatus Rickettsiella viridis TaxID=676208 RepID=A0A2Z5V7U1_9COXI|nr:hypothetical protein RVIR1_13200 [Candidatus Rickettsiella viridis]